VTARSTTTGMLVVLLAVTVGARGQINIHGKTGGTSIRRGVVKDDDKTDEVEALRKSCLYHLAKAEEYFEEGNYNACNLKLRKAKGLLVSRELAERWGELAKKLNKVGNERIADGDKALENKEYRKAIRTYRQASLMFAGLPAGTRARRRLAELERDPSCRAALAEDKAAQLFELAAAVVDRNRRASAPTTRPAAPATRPAPREASIDAGDLQALKGDALLRAADLLERVVKLYPHTPTGRRSAELLQALNDDKACRERLGRLRSGRRAEKALAKADAYRSAGLLKKAAGLYEEVVKSHPGTPQAAEAARQLGVIHAQTGGP